MPYFEQRFAELKQIADHLPAAVIVHQIEGMKMIYMNKTGVEGIGTTLDDLRKLDIDEYHQTHFNSKDSDYYVPKIMELINTNSQERMAYFQEVRSPKQTTWQLHASNTMVFARNQAGKPTHVITIATLLDPTFHITDKVARLVEENAFYREKTPLFLSLTKRERDILKHMALGTSSVEIGEKLNISQTTAETHRRNIRKKLSLNSSYDAVKFAQAFHLI